MLLALPQIIQAAAVRLAWDASPGEPVSEYIVNYGTVPGVYTAHESAGTALTKTITALPTGFRYYFAVTARNGAAESRYSNEVNYREPFTNALTNILIQAELALLEGPIVTKEDIGAMDGKYVTSTNTDAGTCKFIVRLPLPDEFVIWARVLSPTEGQDSFYVSQNSQREDTFDTVHFRTNIWQWTTVNGRGGLDKPFEMAWAIDPRLFTMFGPSEISFRGRETGTGLDAILITNDRALVPRAPTGLTSLRLTLEQ